MSRRRERVLEEQVEHWRALAEQTLERYDALVARLSVDRHASVAPAQPDLPPLVDAKPYISDLPHDDRHWNDFIGVEDDE